MAREFCLAVGLILTLANMQPAVSLEANAQNLLPTLAGTSCQGNDVSWFSGYEGLPSSSVWGSRASIEFYNPDLCGSDTTGGSASVAWVMVSAPSSTLPGNESAAGWAQVGYGQFGYPHPNGPAQEGDIATFAQYTKKCKSTLGCTGSQTVTQWDPTNPTAAWVYKVEFAGGAVGDQHLHMRANGVEILETTYNPGGDWATSWTNSFFGETKDIGSDVVGKTTQQVAFTELDNQSTPGGAWANISSLSPGPYQHEPLRYKKSIFGSLDFRIWTNPIIYP
jgi:hypothetical protein